MHFDPDDLELILLPGRNPPEEYHRYYHLAYECWREVWLEAYQQEMGLHSPLFSDEFTRQDEVMALYHQDECAGLVFFRWVDFKERPSSQDSYFKCWPETALRQLCRNGTRVLVCSQFTLNFKFRKNYLETPWKDLLAALSVQRLRYSDCAVMTGTMRLEKNMGTATYRVGAVPLVKGITYGPGRAADLVAFYQDSVFDSVVPGVSEIVTNLFPKTVALGNRFFQPLEVKRAA